MQIDIGLFPSIYLCLVVRDPPALVKFRTLVVSLSAPWALNDTPYSRMTSFEKNWESLMVWSSKKKTKRLSIYISLISDG